MNNERKVSFSANVGANLITQIVGYLVPLALAPYISRTIGSVGIGSYTYACSIASYFNIVVIFGFASYGTKAVAENRNDEESLMQTFWSIIIARMIICTFAVIAYLFLIRNFNIENNIDQRVFSAMILLFVGSCFDISFYYQGIERVTTLSLINILTNLFYAISIVAFVKSFDDLLLFTILKNSVQIVVGVFSWVLLRPRLRRIRINKTILHTAFRSGFLFFVPSIITKITPIIDTTMLGVLSSTSEVGYYEQANKIKVLIASLIYAIAPIVLSHISFLNKENNIDEVKNKLSKTLHIALYILIPCVFGLYPICKYFFPWYFGPEFIMSVNVMYWLLPSLLFSSIATLLINGVFYAMNQVKQATVLIIICDSINLITNYFAIKQFGAAGAAFTSSFSNGILCFLCLHIGKRFIDTKGLWKNVVRIIICSLIMAVTVFFLGKVLELFQLNKWIITLISVVTGITIYLIMLLINKDAILSEMLIIIKRKMHNE